MTNFSNQIAQLYEERARDQQESQIEEAKSELEYQATLREQIRDYLKTGDAGDRAAAKNLVGEYQLSEQRYNELAQQLAPPPPPFTAQQAAVLNSVPVESLAAPHWFSRSKYNTSNTPQVTGLQALAFAHDQAIANGLAPDTEEYRRFVELAKPEGENPIIQTGDEVVAIFNKNAKYKLSAREYNAGVKKLYGGR